MLPYQLVGGGSFTSDASIAKQEVQVSDRPDLVWVRNRTAWGDDAAETSVESWWRYGMAQDSAQTADQAAATGALSSEAVTANGFRIYNTANPPVYAALPTSGTDITTANPAVVTMASTGSIQVGDVVRLSGTTSMLQISGYDFTVDAVSVNTNITLQLDSSAFAAVATAGNVQLIIPSRFYPRWRYIVPLAGSLGITQAAQAVVCTSVDHDFSVGEKVSFRINSDYGMQELNNVSASIVSVGNVSGGVYTAAASGPYNAFKIDHDTSGYTAFALPTSAVYDAGTTPAIVLPAGAGPTPNGNPPGVSVQAASDNRNKWIISMGSNIITSASAVYDWVAFRYDSFNGS